MLPKLGDQKITKNMHVFHLLGINKAQKGPKMTENRPKIMREKWTFFSVAKVVKVFLTENSTKKIAPKND